ncbi:DUF5987 family protein [Nonomuraea sp. NPDC050556]|uniref:DUF5987 family protein n=1 Tax=Nonomuraea sp. NPDC050556 TaxID=3364369 RepID=UPI003787BD6B
MLGRRSLLLALAMAPMVDLASLPPASAAPGMNALTLSTLEAYADTIVPGEKRYPGDLAVAGAAPGPGAVQAGAMDLLAYPGFGLAPLLPPLAVAMNARVLPFAATRLIPVNPLSPLVSLSYRHRAAFVEDVVGSVFPDQLLWVGVALLASLAFDLAPHLHTGEAVRAGHPGLTWLRYPPPGPDGLWRFESFSYGRQLADAHPATTPQGGPA